MHRLKDNAILLALGVFIFLFTVVLYNSLTHYTVYKYSLSHITKTYHKDSSATIVDSKKEYNKITNKGLNSWDAAIYRIITEDGYGDNAPEANYLFAFFPLFPYFWHILGTTNVGISIVNSILFILSLLFLIDIFFTHKTLREKIVIFTLSVVLPQTISFSIPYPESLFLFSFSIGFWGLINKNYWLYCIGMFFLGMTRPAINILAVAFVCVELYLFLINKKTGKSIVFLFRLLIPLLIGTIIAMTIQYLYSGNFFSYILALQNWGKSGLCLPTEISDWSEYGYSITIFCIAFIVLFSIIYFANHVKENFKNIISLKQNNNDIDLFEKETLMNRFTLYSMVYFIGVFLFILFTQKGSLHGIQRYISATPFFYLFFFYFYDSIIKMGKEKKVTIMIWIMFILGFIGLELWSSKIRFNDFGFFAFFLCLLFLYYQSRCRKTIKYLLFISLILLCILWKTYMLHTFVAEAWIFT